jgi:hypothetical protein
MVLRLQILATPRVTPLRKPWLPCSAVLMWAAHKEGGQSYLPAPHLDLLHYWCVLHGRQHVRPAEQRVAWERLR